MDPFEHHLSLSEKFIGANVLLSAPFVELADVFPVSPKFLIKPFNAVDDASTA